MSMLKLIVALYLGLTVSSSFAQTAASDQSSRYPYTFTNFAWWSDAELRAALARLIPGLPSRIARGSEDESRIRTALEGLLKQQGIHANVQCIEPALQVSYMGRDPDAPPPSIQFSILAPPEIVVENLVIENGQAAAMGEINAEAKRLQGRPYSTAGFWLVRKNLTEAMQHAGYLTAAVEVRKGQVRQDGERYAVKVIASVAAGPKFHISKIDADGGPLLAGKDLSPYYSLKPGDVATPNPFGMLIGSLRAFYIRGGYADVRFDPAPTLDAAHASASYHLKVIPGPVYHLRSVRIEGLTPHQEEEVKRNLHLNPGDIYDELAISRLSGDSSTGSPSLKGYQCSFSPRKDAQAQAIDLTLKFYKE